MNENVISILADSLALPRHKKDGDVPYFQTYPYLLKKSLGNDFHIVEGGKRFRTIVDCLDDYDELVRLKQASIIILHVGIVDCAPRVFTPESRRIVAMLPWIIRVPLLKIIKYMRPFLINEQKPRQWVSARDFKKAYEDIVALAKKEGVQGVVSLGVIRPSDELEQRSPGYKECMEHHNAIIMDICEADTFVKYIDINEIIDNNGGNKALTVDGMHLNNKGHELLAGELIKTIHNLSHVKAEAA